MNTWTRRCAVAALVVGLLVAGPVPAFAAAGYPDAGTLDGVLAAIRAAVQAILESDATLPGGPPVPLPRPDAVLP